MRQLLLSVATVVVASWTGVQAQHTVQVNNGQAYYVITGASGPATTVIDTIGPSSGRFAKTIQPVTNNTVFRGLADGRMEPVTLGPGQLLMGTAAGVRKVELQNGTNTTVTYTPGAGPNDPDIMKVHSTAGGGSSGSTIYVLSEYTFADAVETPGCGGGSPPYTLTIPDAATYIRLSDPGNAFGDHNINKIICETMPCQTGRFIFFEMTGDDVTWQTNGCGGGNIIAATFNTDDDDVIMFVYTGVDWIEVARANN